MAMNPENLVGLLARELNVVDENGAHHVGTDLFDLYPPCA